MGGTRQEGSRRCYNKSMRHKETPMNDTNTSTAQSNEEWIAYYDQHAEVIDDDILDACDEQFGIDVDTLVTAADLPDAYFVAAARAYAARQA